MSDPFTYYEPLPNETHLVSFPIVPVELESGELVRDRGRWTAHFTDRNLVLESVRAVRTSGLPWWKKALGHVGVSLVSSVAGIVTGHPARGLMMTRSMRRALTESGIARKYAATDTFSVPLGAVRSLAPARLECVNLSDNDDVVELQLKRGAKPGLRFTAERAEDGRELLSFARPLIRRRWPKPPPSEKADEFRQSLERMEAELCEAPRGPGFPVWLNRNEGTLRAWAQAIDDDATALERAALSFPERNRLIHLAERIRDLIAERQSERLKDMTQCYYLDWMAINLSAPRWMTSSWPVRVL